MKKIILAVAAILAANGVPAHASWEYKLLEDPMTDAKRGISSVTAEQGMIVIKCDSNGPGSLYLSIISKGYLGGTSRNRVREMKYRIDKGDPQSIYASHDARTASIFDVKPRSKGGDFLGQLLNARELVVQVSSYDYDTYTIIFDVSGARGAIEKSASACRDTNWMPSGAPES